MNCFILGVTDDFKRNPPKEGRFSINCDMFSRISGILDIMGNFNLHFLHYRNPSLTSDDSFKISKFSVPLHFMQNRN